MRQLGNYCVWHGKPKGATGCVEVNKHGQLIKRKRK